jgi:PAS domain S-box-containing protein
METMPRAEEDIKKEVEELKAENKRISDELREARHELDIRVKVRTAEVTKRNEDLHREVTERKCMETELRETKERLEYILDATKTNVDVIDSAFNLRYVDPAWQKVYGAPVGKKCYEYFMERSEPCSGCGIPIALETNKTIVTQEVLLRENNRVIEVHTIPFHGKSGERLVAEFNIDITERKKTEEKFKAVINSTPDGFWIIDLEGRFLEVNPAICRLLDYSPQEMSKMKIADIEAVESEQDILRHIEKIKEFGSDRFETKLRRKDGILIDAEISTSFVIDSSREEGIFAFIRDITERKAGEAALRESREKYRSIVENTTDVVMLTMPDGIISYLSPACEAVLGYSSEELTGKQPWVIHPKDIEKVKEAHYRSLKGESGADFEYRVITKKSKIKWVLHSWSPIIKDNKVCMVVSIIRDITERKQARENLERSKQNIKTTSGKRFSYRPLQPPLFRRDYRSRV